MPIRSALQSRMNAARQAALAAGATQEAVDQVAPIYESLYIEALERVEHRLVTEIWNGTGWSIYHHVPLSSHEIEALPAIAAKAAEQQRPMVPQAGDYGLAWIESRVVGRWRRDE